jgi:hypothetical protein
VLGLIEENGTGYLAEEYVEGQSLAAILERRGKLPEAEIRFLLSPLLDGLEQVHRVGLVHSGIEPADILFRSGGVPVLVGFGAPRPSTSARGPEADAGPTWNEYAPHEIYDSRASVGPWTDIYALGAVLYRTVAGVAPPSGAARVAALDGGKPDPYRAAQGLPGYSAGLLAAIDRALALVERERPQSLAAFRGALSRTPEGASEAPVRRKAEEPLLFDLETAKVPAPSGTREIAPVHKVRGLRRRAPLPDSPPPLAGPVPGAPMPPAAPVAAAASAEAKAAPRRAVPRTWIWIVAFGGVIAAGLLGWRQYEAGMQRAAAPASVTPAPDAPEARRAEEQRRAAAQRQAEEAQKEAVRRTQEAQKAEAARQAEEARKADETRRAEEARKADETRKAEEARQAEEARKA